jgi:hypothetical protein
MPASSMRTTFQFNNFLSALLLPTAMLALVSCSSTPPPPSAVPTPVASSGSPELIDAGVLTDTASGMLTVESIDPAQRVLVLKRPTGDTLAFQAGPEITRFNQIKVGDQIMTTVNENLTIFVVKGKMTPQAAASQALVRTPPGANVGGMVVTSINIDARVLDVDPESRQVLLQYGPTQTRSVTARPSIDLSLVGVGDTVLVRGTRTISILVGNP